MPATAAIDNETLDHLLSVVDDSRNLGVICGLSKAGCIGEGRGGAPRVALPNLQGSRPVTARPDFWPILDPCSLAARGDTMMI